MKGFKLYFTVGLLFFVAALALLEVDRRCGLMYGEGGTISDSLQVFIENRLDLH